MAYFDYHAKVKKLVKEGKLSGYYFDKQYKKIGFVLVLVFDEKKYPIREDRFEEYFDLIGEFYDTKQGKGQFFTKYLF